MAAMSRMCRGSGHIGGDDAAEIPLGGVAPVYLIAHGIGEAGSGLTVVVWGPALDQDVVSAETAELMVGHPAHPTARRTARLAGTPAAADFDLTIPTGFSDQAAAFRGAPAEEGARRWLESRIEVSVTLRGQQLGTSEIHLSLVPEGDGDRAASRTVEVEVTS